MNDLLMSVFTKFFNKTEDELTELLFEGEGEDRKLKDGAAESLIALDEEKVKRIREGASGDATKKFDEGYNKAKKEVLSKFEVAFKEKLDRDWETSS